MTLGGKQTLVGADSIVEFKPCSDCGQMVVITEKGKLAQRQQKVSVHYARIMFRKYQEAGFKKDV